MRFSMPAAEALSHLKAALIFASKDATRTHLHAVRVEVLAAPRVARMVATDGHRLWMSDAFVTSDVPGVTLLDRLDVATIVKTIDRKGVDVEFAIAIDGNVRNVHVTQGARTIAIVPESAATFPPYQQIIPQAETSRASARVAPCLDSKYLSDACEAFVLIASTRGKAPGVYVVPGEGELDPICVASTDAPQALAIVMPRRDDDSRDALPGTLARFLGKRVSDCVHTAPKEGANVAPLASAKKRAR